jgi:hypothetical protein
MKHWLVRLLAGGLVLSASAESQPAGELAGEAGSASMDAATMQRIYDKVKTPCKYRIVLRGDSTNQLVDYPSIFREGRKWIMIYVAVTDAVG